LRVRGRMILRLPDTITRAVLWEGGPRGYRQSVKAEEGSVTVEFEAGSPGKAASGINATLSCVRSAQELLKVLEGDRDHGGGNSWARG